MFVNGYEWVICV